MVGANARTIQEEDEEVHVATANMEAAAANNNKEDNNLVLVFVVLILLLPEGR